MGSDFRNFNLTRGADAAPPLTSCLNDLALLEQVHRSSAEMALAKLVGVSTGFLGVIKQVRLLSSSRSPVIITGETGTGKELVARAIHYLSGRASFPFIPINCGALPESLLEDELFGHERGAFSEAHRRRAGLIEAADRGTLFLDEVDSLSHRAQTALLRVLQDKCLRLVGSNIEKAVDVRVLAASNVDLQARVQLGQFRKDLFYRLAVFAVHLPPLRERADDILPLAEHFMRKHTAAGMTLALSPTARAELLRHPWRGNVRELENAIIRGCHLCDGGTISGADLGLSETETGAFATAGEPALIASPHPFAPVSSQHPWETLRESKNRVIAAFEKDYLQRLMQKYGWKVTHAARAAGKERRDLGRLLKKYGITPQA